MSSETSAEVQREAEVERAELVSTLDQLRENLKPANVVDEVMATAKVTTSDITDRVWQTARSNPIAAVFIGLGAAMILGVGQPLTSRLTKKDDGDSDYDQPYRRPHGSTYERQAGLGPAMQQGAASVQAWSASKLKSVGPQVAASASKVTDSASSWRSRAFQPPSSYASSARQGLASRPGDQAMSQYSRSRDQIAGSISRLLDEQPLVLAALGVAVGAAIGAAIPSTETEGQFMGDASASLKARAQELAQQEYAHLKETASNTLGDLKQTAADRGLSTDNVQGLIQDAGAKVRDAAHGVADHAADQAGLKS